MVACCALVTACGDDDERRSGPDVVETPRAATASPAATRTPTPSPAGTESPAGEGAGEGDGEGGDEAGNRIGLTFELLDGEIAPRRVEVSAFLGLELTLRNRSSTERAIRLDGRRLAVVAPATEQVLTVDGLQPGEHALTAGSSARAVLVAVRAGG